MLRRARCTAKHDFVHNTTVEESCSVKGTYCMYWPRANTGVDKITCRVVAVDTFRKHFRPVAYLLPIPFDRLLQHVTPLWCVCACGYILPHSRKPVSSIAAIAWKQVGRFALGSSLGAPS